jgi:RNA polymerase sigma factor (sigma-70 family)
MKITDPGIDTIHAATQGDLRAIDALLSGIQPGVFNLAVRMLGNRDDAADATQEILLKVVTHLGGFRRESAFTTWVYQIARNHLLTAITRTKESPEVSFEGIAERLEAGLVVGASLYEPGQTDQALTPEDKFTARQVAMSCTQNMLMALDREQRLVYVLDAVFGLSSKQAAEVIGISPEAYRQRLTRARTRLDAFTAKSCGLANPAAPCRCDKQLPALRELRRTQPIAPPTLFAIHRAEREVAERQFDALVRMCDAASLFRAHPEYQVPESMRGAIRAVLRAEGYWGDDRPLQ